MNGSPASALARQSGSVSESDMESKPILWTRRSDLQAVPMEFENRPAWGIKDPITLGYFELREEAYFIWNQLNGIRTFKEVCDAFHERFRPRTLSLQDLQTFVGQLVSQGLVAAVAPGYGSSLVAKGRAIAARRKWNRLAGILAIRFRGFDPDLLLGWMHEWLKWIYAPWAICAGLLLMASSIVLVTVQFDQLLERLPDAHAMLTLTNLIWLSVLLAGVKILHELGHGLTCKHFGGECHELGFMLLVFSPTLYCNVTDIWMMKSKWQRMAVGAAGMWVEAMIASACTLLWWFSEPGLFHSLCLNLMFLCGVSTFIFNGNPLLRYDGYFVLADWLEIPNLQQQSSSIVRGVMTRWFCGFDDGASRDMSWRRMIGLFTFGVASTAYRLLLTIVILWTLHRWLEPLGFGVFVQLLAIPTIGLMVLMPVFNLTRFLRSPVTQRRMNNARFALRGGAVLVLLGLLMTYPFPSRVAGEALIEVGEDQAERIYVTSSGTLVESARVGQHVKAGQVIARLEEPLLRLEIIKIEGELKQQQQKLEQLERRRVEEKNVAAAIPSQRKIVDDLKQQLEQRQHDSERLTLRAGRDGMILPVPFRSSDTTSGHLAHWTGIPLDERNLGCHVLAGTPVCLVGDDTHRTAIVLIHQHDINLVRIDQSVRLVLHELQGEILTGRITELGALNLDTLPRETIIRLDLPYRPTPTGALRPIDTWYQAKVKLDESDAPLPLGAAGSAKVIVDATPLYQRAIRWLSQTFSL